MRLMESRGIRTSGDFDAYADCTYDGKGTVLPKEYLDGASETCVQQVSHLMSPAYAPRRLSIPYG
jgi:hypothetical protein